MTPDPGHSGKSANRVPNGVGTGVFISPYFARDVIDGSFVDEQGAEY
jgi:hypothetical protein